MEAGGGAFSLLASVSMICATRAITELAERGASDATFMAIAGHQNRALMEHCSHVTMKAKRAAVEGLTTALIQPLAAGPGPTIKVLQ